MKYWKKRSYRNEIIKCRYQQFPVDSVVGLLNEVYENVLIPNAVEREIIAGGKNRSGAREFGESHMAECDGNPGSRQSFSAS